MNLAFADLPVHCLQDQITGEWTFHLEAPVNFTGEERQHLCGHELPDNPETSNIEKYGFIKDIY